MSEAILNIPPMYHIKLLKETLKALGKKGLKSFKEFVKAWILKSSEYFNKAVQLWAEKNGTK